METDRKTPATVDDYIAGHSSEVRAILEAIRATVKSAAPAARERIGYNMPTFSLGRDIVHFGAFKTHIGLYPPVRDPDLAKETLEYRGEKGNLRFPLDRPVPYPLIARVVRARVSEIRAREGAKRGGKRVDYARRPPSGGR